MITAVVLNYNSTAQAATCIDMLRRQSGVQCQIVVVDNGSTPAQLSELRSVCSAAGVLLIESLDNRGYSAGNNIGLQWAIEGASDWALVINPDVEIRDPEYLRTLLHQAALYPEAVVVGSDIVLPDGQHQNPMREISYVEEVLWPVDLIRSRLGRPIDYLERRETGYCDKLCGCCLLIRCSYLASHGLLDEGLFLYCEEPVLAKQVQADGYRMLYVDEALAHHMHYAATHSSPDAMAIMLHSRCYYLREHSGYKGLGLALALASRRIQALVWRTLVGGGLRFGRRGHSRAQKGGSQSVG